MTKPTANGTHAASDVDAVKKEFEDKIAALDAELEKLKATSNGSVGESVETKKAKSDVEAAEKELATATSNCGGSIPWHRWTSAASHP